MPRECLWYHRLAGMVDVGTVLGGYRVVRKLGSGGMGTVYVAEHLVLGRLAAVKVLLPQLSNNEDLVRRFFNEARAATRIHHPGIVEVFDFGQATDGSAFIVMELLEGESLSQRLARRRSLSIPEVVRLARFLASALAAAHAAGIVHRDLKPDNIHLTPDPDVDGGERVKILDFGIAKLVDNPDGVRTHSGSIMGTPRYMAPEQCRGLGSVDHRADIYSLACIMFELLTGRPPFDSPSAGELTAAHLMLPPPVPTSLKPDLPTAIDGVLLRGLAKNPVDRYQTVDEFLRALGKAALGIEIDTQAPTVPRQYMGRRAPVHPAFLSTLGGAASESTPRPRRRRTRFLLFGGGAAAALGVAVVVLMKIGSAPNAEVEPAGRSAAGDAQPDDEPVVTQPAVVGKGNSDAGPLVEASASISSTPAAPVPHHSVRLRGLPARAKVTLDGHPAEASVARIPVDGERHELVIRARGYRDAKLLVDASSPKELRVELERVTHDDPAAASRPPEQRPDGGQVEAPLRPYRPDEIIPPTKRPK